MRSMAKAASGRPAPRYGAFGVLLVAAMRASMAMRVDLVRAGQMRGGVVDHAGADRIPGAAIDHKTVAQRQDAALFVEADLHVVDLVARMARADQMLAAVLDPLHRPAEPARQERDQQIFRIDVALDAETAADIERDAAHARLGQVAAPRPPRAAPNAPPGSTTRSSPGRCADRAGRPRRGIPSAWRRSGDDESGA